MERNENGLSALFPNAPPSHPKQLAMVYSPVQCWRMFYEAEQALSRGSLFRELDKPLEEEC